MKGFDLFYFNGDLWIMLLNWLSGFVINKKKLFISFFGIFVVKVELYKVVRLVGVMFIIFLMGKKFNIFLDDVDMIIFNDFVGFELL